MFHLFARVRQLILLGCGVVLLVGCGSVYRGPVSDHFDGSRFFNPGHEKSSSVAGYLWLRLTSTQGVWPDAVALESAAPPPERITQGPARVTFIGNATLLVQVAGLNILTDPIWSERASPLGFVGPKRVAPPAVAFDALPRIDLVLISHDHHDHLDPATLARLDARDRPRVVVPLGVRSLVAAHMPGSEVSEHDWGERVAKGGAVIHVEPMLHGSGRTPFDQQQRLWAAYVVQAAGLKLLFVGDSGRGDGQLFRQLGVKHPGLDLAMLPIGAYEPAAFMADSHMSPAEAVQVRADLQARRAMAHHFEAFQLGFESFEAPRAALKAALSSAGLTDGDFVALQPGGFLNISPVQVP